MLRLTMVLALPLMAIACSGPAEDAGVTNDAAPSNTITMDVPPAPVTTNDVVEANVTEDAAFTDAHGFTWPQTLKPFGDGFPRAGDRCYNVGETSATVDYLDHTQVLVGCPGDGTDAAAQKLLEAGGKLVDTHEGVALITIPTATAKAVQQQGATAN